MQWPNENSAFPSFTVPHHFRNLIKMWYIFPRYCHIFLSSWHLIWRWQTGRCTVLWQICKPWIDLCSTRGNMQAWNLATYHKSRFTSLLIDFLRAERQCGDGWGSVPHCHPLLLVIYGWGITPVSLRCPLFAWVVLCWGLQCYITVFECLLHVLQNTTQNKQTKKPT